MTIQEILTSEHGLEKLLCFMQKRGEMHRADAEVQRMSSTTAAERAAMRKAESCESFAATIKATISLMKSKQKRGTFLHPDVTSVWIEMKSKGIPSVAAEKEAEKFMAHYGANGWKVGPNRMADWRAAVSKWACKYFEDHPQQRPKAKDAEYAFNGPKWRMFLTSKAMKFQDEKAAPEFLKNEFAEWKRAQG